MLLLACATVAVPVGFSSLSPDMQDRYLSIVGLGAKNAGTAEERVGAMEGQWGVAMRRPLFGHGLGTSREANYHFNDSGTYAGLAIAAHNLYLEIAQELGLVGLVIFLSFMKSVIIEFIDTRRQQSVREAAGAFLPRFIDAIQVLIVMDIVSSLASYGLSSYEWYLFGAFSVVMQRIETQKASEDGSGRANERNVGLRVTFSDGAGKPRALWRRHSDRA
jgi:putative inorganic carbon (hco3(-)) transporter